MQHVFDMFSTKKFENLLRRSRAPLSTAKQLSRCATCTSVARVVVRCQTVFEPEVVARATCSNEVTNHSLFLVTVRHSNARVFHSTHATSVAYTGSLIVSGATNPPTYELVQTVIADPSPPGTATGQILLLDDDAVAIVGADYSVQYVSGGTLAGVSPFRGVITKVTGGTGVAQFAGLVHGATYRPWRGDETANPNGSSGTSGPFGSGQGGVSGRTFVVPAVASFSITE